MAAFASTSSSTSCAASSTSCDDARPDASPAAAARDAAAAATAGAATRPRPRAPAFAAKAGEELVGELLGGRIDQPRAELRELAADLRVDRVGRARVRAVGGEMHVRAALGEAGDAALAFAGDRVAFRRVDVGERHLRR